MRLNAVAVLVLLSALLAPEAAAWEPSGGGTFNNPRGNHAARWKIINHVNKAVRSAKPGSTIMMSMFLMDSKPSADALIAARRRGVHVQLVFDGDDARTGQTRRMARIMNRDNKPKQPVPDRWGRDQSYVVFCKGSCRGGPHNNHSKYYVFTRTGTARNVVMVSSSNLNRGGASKGWNDLYVAKRNPRMVKQYASVHQQMAADRPAGNRYRQLRSGRYLSRFFPKPKGPDPVMTDLGKVRCRGAGGGAGRGGRTAINVSMFAWNGDRGMAIARKLIRLDRDGCHVSIVYGAPSAKVRDVLKASAQRGGIKLWDSRMDRKNQGFFDLRVHHKYLLINGRYGSDRSSWRVHTGSANWGRGTLRGGDENTLNVVSRRAYRQYIRNWDHVVRTSSRRIG